MRSDLPAIVRAPLLEGEHRILRMMARGETLPRVFDEITRLGETLMSDGLCSLLTVDDDLVLRHGAAPSLPLSYQRHIDGVKAGPGIGSCGSAVFERRRVVVPDIATHPFWREYRALALPHGLRACWSDCITDRTGNALGSFAIYYRDSREPRPRDLAVIDGLRDLASIAIERGRADERHRAMNRELAEQGRELSQATRQADAARRAKSAMLTNMSHELRTPLNAIVGFSEILTNELFGPLGAERYKEYAGDILRAGLHLRSLISDLLDMARIDARARRIDREPIDIAAEIEEIARIMEPRATEGQVSVVLDLAKAPRHVMADGRSFRQIVVNLVGNAVKFTPPGGRVTIRVDGDAGAARLEVRDTGVGIPADKLDQLGLPFSRFDNPHSSTNEGAGLGLAIAKSLVELHGWSLRLESRIGEGTRATVEMTDRPQAGEAPRLVEMK
jgi:two-component system, cell cycle sensor histidine kinase PleC